METINEIWKPVVGFDGLYEVSNLGSVRSLCRYVNGFNGKKLKKGKKLKTTINIQGYCVVDICYKNKRKQYRVHRLVAEAFIPNPENKPYIDHINTIRSDNRVENLRWVTAQENRNNELTKIKCSELQKGEKGYWYGCTGSSNPHAKAVKQYTLDGEYLCTFDSIVDAHKALNVEKSHIYQCCKGIYKSSLGYRWEYV